MSKVQVTESYLSDIADAIRTKSGGGVLLISLVRWHKGF